MTDKRYSSRIEQQVAIWMQRQEALNRAAISPRPKDLVGAKERSLTCESAERLP